MSVRPFKPVSARLAFEARPVRIAAGYGHTLPRSRGGDFLLYDWTRSPRHQQVLQSQVAEDSRQYLTDPHQRYDDIEFGVGHGSAAGAD